MITVYICSREEWENNVTAKPKCLVHYFPETLYSYKDWFEFYNKLETGYQVVVSQSSELLKYLSSTQQPYKIYMWEDDWVLHEDVDSVRMKLLACYEKLMVKEYLFKD